MSRPGTYCGMKIVHDTAELNEDYLSLWASSLVECCMYSGSQKS